MEREIIEEIRNKSVFLIASHIRPEGDAIGSALALAISLNNMGKEVTVFNQDPIPRNLQFLPMSTEIVHEIDDSFHYDVALVLDCGDLDRVGNVAEKIRRTGKIINIDHHKTNSGFGDLRLINTYKSSTGEILYDLLQEIPIPITYEIAVNIYTAILTDTGAFCHSNTTARTFQIAGELVTRGVNPSTVAEEIYERQSVSRLRLLALVLNTLEISDHGKVGSVVVLSSMLERVGATPDLGENMVDYPRSIEGVRVAVLFREVSKDQYRISLRSDGCIDVADIAKEFGGGGHPRASGCGVKGSLPEVKDKVFPAIRRRLIGSLE